MKTTFETAFIIIEGKKRRQTKQYYTLNGFRRGLKVNNCPFTVNESGYFSGDNGLLSGRQWNYAGVKFTAHVSNNE